MKTQHVASAALAAFLIAATLGPASAAPPAGTNPGGTSTRAPAPRGFKGIAGVVVSPTTDCPTCGSQPNTGAFIVSVNQQDKELTVRYDGSTQFKLNGATVRGNALAQGQKVTLSGKTLSDGSKLATKVILRGGGLTPGVVLPPTGGQGEPPAGGG